MFEPRACQGETRLSTAGGEQKVHTAWVLLTAPPRLRVWASAWSSGNSQNMNKWGFDTHMSSITGINELLRYSCLQPDRQQASSEDETGRFKCIAPFIYLLDFLKRLIMAALCVELMLLSIGAL